ncbi:hypothetical protein D3C81_2288760 [compost metagenome]
MLVTLLHLNYLQKMHMVKKTNVLLPNYQQICLKKLVYLQLEKLSHYKITKVTNSVL